MNSLSFASLPVAQKSFILDALSTQEEDLSDDEIDTLAADTFNQRLKELLSKPGYQVYRCVYASESDALAIKDGAQTGSHWSLRKSVAENWVVTSQDVDDPLKHKFILQASVSLDDIDIAATVSNNIACPHEFEITIQDGRHVTLCGMTRSD